MKLIFASLLILTVFFATAQHALPVKKVTIFKNATAMLVKEGSAPVRNGYVLLPIPKQTLSGTYFIGSAKDNAVKNIVFRNDTLKKQENSLTVGHFLSGNLNRAVSISYTPTSGTDKTISGKIVSCDLNSGLLKLSTEGGKTTVMNIKQIYQADFKEDPSIYYMADSVSRMIVLKPEKIVDNLSLQEIYMTGGINWLPSYFLKLKDDKTARLEMKATVENFAEDLTEADVELVVGAPQMLYNNKMDPMTYDYLTVAGSGFAHAYAGKAYMQSNARTAEADGEAGGYFEENFSTEGEKSGDLYIYKLGKITLPNKTKGTFPIFAGNVEYQDKYEGSIYDITNYFNSRFVPQEEATFDVFHSLELKNTATVPLTTASVVVLNEKDQFVAQDELKYTPVGANSTIRISKAIDIVMKNSEEEKNREDNAKKIGKNTYSKVVLKGTVNIDNYQNKEVVVTIKKTLNGTVLTVSNGGKNTKGKSYNFINPVSVIDWEIKLKANEKKVLTYEYEVFFTP